MDARPPDRLEELLTRAFDGETTPDEREELAALADIESKLAALAELRAALRAALAAPGAVDVAGEVMEILSAEDGWGLGDALRGAVAAPVDVADGVFEALALEARWAHGPAIRAALAAPVDLADGVVASVDNLAREAVEADEAGSPWIGEALRDATALPVDVWAGVAEAIGAEPDAVHGWDEVAAPLRAAFAAIPRIDVADAVLAAVGVGAADGAAARRVPAARGAAPAMPRWASLGGPIFAFAAAAAMLLSVLPPPSPGRVVAPAVLLATVNDAQVEEVSAPNDVVVQVMQFEEGGPTFILVDDPSGPGVPL